MADCVKASLKLNEKLQLYALWCLMPGWIFHVHNWLRAECNGHVEILAGSVIGCYIFLGKYRYRTIFDTAGLITTLKQWSNKSHLENTWKPPGWKHSFINFARQVWAMFHHTGDAVELRRNCFVRKVISRNLRIFSPIKLQAIAYGWNDKK